MKSIIPIFLALTLTSACGKKEESSEAPPAPGAEAKPASAPAPAPAPVADPSTDPPTTDKAEPKADLPTVTDFEDEANEQINDDNLEKELLAVEKELGE